MTRPPRTSWAPCPARRSPPWATTPTPTAPSRTTQTATLLPGAPTRPRPCPPPATTSTTPPGLADTSTTSGRSWHPSGGAASDPSKGYYSYDLGSWHVVVLNSNCRPVGGCTGTSPQVQWLKDDLAAHPSACTLAYWHEPRFSSIQTGTRLAPFWKAL